MFLCVSECVLYMHVSADSHMTEDAHIDLKNLSDSLGLEVEVVVAGSWEPNPRPQKEQHILFRAEPSLQSPKITTDSKKDQDL